MVSFISGTLLEEEPCCYKLMLKHDTFKITSDNSGKL